MTKTERSLLRVVTAGSVDDGKSTLIGRLLYDSRSVPEDQRESLAREYAGEPIEYARLLDGLEAERQQGITIDVAYRYFRSGARRFIVADSPGHEQYTENMATAASTSQVAILLVDARQGFMKQSRRHAMIAATMGIRHFIVAVNKMDMTNWDQTRFRATENQARKFLERFGEMELHVVPISALHGDNVSTASRETPWYDDRPLLSILEEIEVGSSEETHALFPVQNVIRVPDFRGYAGTVRAGSVLPGQMLRAWPSGQDVRVEEILTMSGPQATGSEGEAVVLTLDREIDLMRGDLLADPDAAVVPCRAAELTVVWMSETPLAPNDVLLVKHLHQYVEARCTEVVTSLSVTTGDRIPVDEVEFNHVARIRMRFVRPIVATPYRINASHGALLLIDPISGRTLGCGLLESLDPATLVNTAAAVEETEFHERMGQTPHLITVEAPTRDRALSLGRQIERRLFEEGIVAVLLQGEAGSTGAADAESPIPLLQRVGVLPITVVVGNGIESVQIEPYGGSGETGVGKDAPVFRTRIGTRQKDTLGNESGDRQTETGGSPPANGMQNGQSGVPLNGPQNGNGAANSNPDAEAQNGAHPESGRQDGHDDEQTTNTVLIRVGGRPDPTMERLVRALRPFTDGGISVDLPEGVPA